MEDLRVKKTKNAVFDALFNLLSENSMEKISVSDICKTAQIGRATFYNYFRDKYDLFEAIIEKIKVDFFETPLSKKNFNNLSEFHHELIVLAFNFLFENKKTLAKMLKFNNDEMIRMLLVGTMVKALEEKLNQNKNHFQVPISLISNYYIGGFISLAIWWLQTPNKFSKTEMIVYTSKLIESQILI